MTLSWFNSKMHKALAAGCEVSFIETRCWNRPQKSGCLIQSCELKIHQLQNYSILWFLLFQTNALASVKADGVLLEKNF